MKLFIDSSLHSKIGKFLSGLNPSISISSSSLPQATEFPVLQIKEGTQISGLVDVSKEVINSSHSLQHLLGSNENDKKEVIKKTQKFRFF